MDSPPRKLGPPPQILDPPSPRTHRALRRLQSAHALGHSNSQPSLIQQQHKQQLQRTQSPANTPHHTRGRSNSDATNMTPPHPGAAGRRAIAGKKPAAADAISLDRLIRDGPPDGDLISALESMRLKILDQGIKSDTDGMVRYYTFLLTPVLMAGSPHSGYTYGSYYLMLPCLRLIPTSPSYTVELPPPTPRSETIPSER